MLAKVLSEMQQKVKYAFNHKAISIRIKMDLKRIIQHNNYLILFSFL